MAGAEDYHKKAGEPHAEALAITTESDEHNLDHYEGVNSGSYRKEMMRVEVDGQNQRKHRDTSHIYWFEIGAIISWNLCLELTKMQTKNEKERREIWEASLYFHYRGELCRMQG